VLPRSSYVGSQDDLQILGDHKECAFNNQNINNYFASSLGGGSKKRDTFFQRMKRLERSKQLKKRQELLENELRKYAFRKSRKLKKSRGRKRRSYRKSR